MKTLGTTASGRPVVPVTVNPRKVGAFHLKALENQAPSVQASIQRINVNDIEVDTYQRDIRPAKLKRLIREWDPAQAGWVTLSLRENGLLYVPDGQHRVEAVRHVQAKFGPYLDAIVVEGWTADDEAAFFLTQKAESRTAITPEDVHNAALMAFGRPEYEDAQEIQAILDAANLRIGNVKEGNEHTGRIRTVKPIYATYRKYGARVLRETLQVIIDSWGIHANPETAVVSGTALFLGMYQQVKVADVSKRPRLLPIAEWVIAAKNTARNERLTAAEGVAYKLRTDYNYRRTANLLPDFRDTLQSHRFAIRSEASKANVARLGSVGGKKVVR